MSGPIWPECVGSFLDEESIDTIDWPPRTPELNPTELNVGASHNGKYMATDCPRAQWCPDSSLGGESPGHHQEHAQTLAGEHTGTQWAIYTTKSHYEMLDKIHTSLSSLWFQFFYFDVQCDFEASFQWVIDFGSQFCSSK